MALIEERYMPSSLSEIVSPNWSEVQTLLDTQMQQHKMNLMFIGSVNTFKQQAMHIVLEEYYRRMNITSWKDYVLTVDSFSEITLSSTMNDLKTFCKTNSTVKKCVFIDNFDIITEVNQQYMKALMDSCPSVFFFFGCENTSKIHNVIQTRTTPVYFPDLTYTEYSVLLQRLEEGEGVHIRNKDVLLAHSHLSVYYLFNLFNKLNLLGLKEVDDIKPHLTMVDDNVLSMYFDDVAAGRLKEATSHVFFLFEKGYSLLDIYYFLYEFLKT
jgi:DNA polymerase III delta prime subunit